MVKVDSHHILTGIKELHKKQVIMVKDVIIIEMIFKNGKLISIATLHTFINLYRIIKWEQ